MAVLPLVVTKAEQQSKTASIEQSVSDLCAQLGINISTILPVKVRNTFLEKKR